MGRPGQKVLKDEDGLADRISLGLLARVFPRATVEAVVQAAKAREQRTRMLPSWLVVYYVLALALFMDMGGGRVMRKLAGTLSWAARGVTVVLPSEKALTMELLPLLGEGMLVLADRNFPGYDLWGRAAATGADLLWRVGSIFPLPVVAVLADGSYLSRLSPPRKELRDGAAPIVVRVVEYHLLAPDGTPTEVFALITTLLDVEAAPAGELAELYHARWQIENAFGALKSQLKGDGVVLRSKTPDGAEQELWALLCAYHAIRELICAAAELTDQDPLRLSFIAALDAVRGPVGDPAAFPP